MTCASSTTAAPSSPRSFDSFRLVERVRRDRRASTEASRRTATTRRSKPRTRSSARSRASRATSRSRPTTTCCPRTSCATATRMQLIDWEYAGMGDRWFDLGNFAVNNELDDDRRGARCSRPTSASRRTTGARAALKLFRFMSDFREAMWGVVQAGVSELDFDFRRLRRRSTSTAWRRRASDPRFEGWLEEAAASGRARELPERRALRDRRRRRRRHVDRLPPGRARLGRRRAASSATSSRRARRSTPRASSASCAARCTLTRMMMYSVELYRKLGEDVRLGRVRRHPARVERGAHGGAAPPGGLGEDVRPAARADLGGRGARSCSR